MAYSVPTFNLTAAIQNPLDAGPRVISPCNVAYGRRVTTQGWYQMGGTDSVFTYLLFPAGTDVRDIHSTTGVDHVEVPQGSGRWFAVDAVLDSGLGFPNEHRVAVCHKVGIWPTPLPAVYVAPTAASAVAGGAALVRPRVSVPPCPRT